MDPVKRVLLPQVKREVQVVTSTPLAKALLAEQLELPMACGGQGRCATCHVYVRSGERNLSPQTDAEKRALSRITSKQECSRLACQARVMGTVEVALPEGTYIEDIRDLEQLIGRRVETDILHPVDGRVLLKRGQIVSRTILKKLESVDFAKDRLAGSSDVASRTII
jgi:ferredoxin